MLPREVPASAGEGGAQHPRRQAEKQQHGGQHQGDIAAGARFGFGRGLGDAKGVDEGIDQQAERIHMVSDDAALGVDAGFGHSGGGRLHPARAAAHLTDAYEFACHDRIGRIYWRGRSSKEIHYGHRSSYPHP